MKNVGIKSKNKAILLATLTALNIQACSAIPLSPGAERVILSRNPAPKGCKFLGSVVGSQGGAFTGGFTSNKNLAEGALNDMRNKGFQLGANYVQIETDRAGVTGSGSISTSQYGLFGASSSEQTDVTQTGNAYRCNPADIGLE